MIKAILAFMLTAGIAVADSSAPFASFVDASEPVLSDPHDLAFGADGNLYIADKFANRVAVMNPETLEITGSIGDGVLIGAHDVSFDPDGLLYVAATGLNAVISYDLSGSTPKSIGILRPFSRTEGVLAHSNGRLYVMASGTGQLVSILGNNVVTLIGGLTGAHDVAEAPDGTIWVADNQNRRLVQFSQDLEQLGTLEGPHFGFAGPRYLDIDEDGIIYVADQDAHRVFKIDPKANEIMGTIGSGTPGKGPNLLDDPEGVAIRGSEYFFADSDNNRIVKYVVVLN